MVIKAVIFDCFGVLVTSARKALKNDYPQSVEQLDDLDHQADYGMITRDEYNDAISKIIGLPNGQIETKYWGGSVKVDSVIDWLRQLKHDGYKVGLLSNIGPGFFASYFSDKERQELFDEVILSSDVGVAKPDVAAYQMILDKLGVKPDESVMVDDTMLNIEVAESLGMHGIWFITLEQTKNQFNKIVGEQSA